MRDSEKTWPIFPRLLQIAPAVIVGMACVISAGRSEAAACCASATAFGVGRLLVWEEFAVGLRIGHARSLGQWDGNSHLRLNADGYSDGLTRLEPWVIARLHERVQAQACLPVLANDRGSGGQQQVAGGLGDAGAAMRFEILSMGQYSGLPSLALTAGGVFPLGRRPEQTSPPLFAGSTGRGSWGATFGLESEYVFLPWFVRMDTGFTYFLSFQRSDTHVRQHYGTLAQVGLSLGKEVVPDRLTAALGATADWEGPLRLDGKSMPDSQAFLLDMALLVSWRAFPHWTLIATGNNTVWPGALGKNRDARVGTTLGVRYGYY